MLSKLVIIGLASQSAKESHIIFDPVRKLVIKINACATIFKSMLTATKKHYLYPDDFENNAILKRQVFEAMQ